ncbi:MAG: flavin reductase family protein [Trueperaceae bacterium]|nr:flavin reductase family protein [Trueperaceae bacterium]
MRFELADMAPRDRYKLLTGTVVPRPIGWIATVDEEGRRNLAPFSFFNVVSASPPTLMFSGGRRNGLPKDSAANALATGQFVAHIAGTELLDAMNATSIDAPPGEDEFAYADLEAVPSERVRPPRLAAAPVAFECEVVHTYEVAPGGNTVVFGRALIAHLRDDLVLEGGRIDVRALSPVARLAGTQYATLGEILERARPSWHPQAGD